MIGKQHQPFSQNLSIGIQARMGIGALCLFLGLATSGHAQQMSQDVNSPAALNQTLGEESGLTVQEIEAVLEEIDAMKRTGHAAVINFPIKAVTPERLSRLFAAPSLRLLPSMTRTNGLIFAGQLGAKLMAFDKPSDVIRKGERWFPAELSNARGKITDSSRFQLMGPYANWTTEAAAFAAVWNCMPKSVWLHPTRAPFAKSSQENTVLPLIAKDSGEVETAVFKRCVREWNGREPEIPAQQHEALDKLATSVEQFLAIKFASFLQKNHCKGAGIDDCVWIFNWWASLSPEDPVLAEMLQTLAQDVGMASPLPAAGNPADDWKMLQPRYDEVWRREAFVHAKLLSIFKAPEAWPKNALETGLIELDALEREIEKTYYKFDKTVIFNPLLALRSERRPEDIHTSGLYRSIHRRQAWELQPRDATTVQRVDAAVMALLRDPATNNECGAVKRWLSTEMEVKWLKQTMFSSESLPTCLHIDWAWLRKGTDELATTTREFVSKRLPDAKAVLRDQVLENLTIDGRECVATDPPATDQWLKEICKQWIPGPDEVDFQLDQAKQGQPPSIDFFMREISFSDEEAIQKRLTSLRALSEGMQEPSKKQFTHLIGSLRHKLSGYESAAIWRHTDHSRSLLRLTLFNDGNPIDNFYLLSPSAATQIHVPDRFSSGWNGSQVDQELARVSDRDHDGQLELWWASPHEVRSLSKCAEDESDLNRDLRCRGGEIKAELGELDGNSLSYARLGPQTKVTPPSGEDWSFEKQLSKIPSSWRVPEFPGPPCNRVLIGSVLGPALGITDWSKYSEGAQNVISLTCKAHPLHPELTIVALFHELPNWEDKSSENASKYGFAFAVVDIKGHRVIRLYQSQVEEDGSTRVAGGGLEIDTGRYWLKKGVRALGVRMNIGWSPSAADGGNNNYLTLFVEEGEALRPVLEFMPMYLWSFDGPDGCVFPQWANEERGDTPCDYISAGVTLTPEKIAGQEWRDLIARIASGGDTPPQKMRLRYENARYSSPWFSIKP